MPKGRGEAKALKKSAEETSLQSKEDKNGNRKRGRSQTRSRSVANEIAMEAVERNDPSDDEVVIPKCKKEVNLQKLQMEIKM